MELNGKVSNFENKNLFNTLFGSVWSQMNFMKMCYIYMVTMPRAVSQTRICCNRFENWIESLLFWSCKFLFAELYSRFWTSMFAICLRSGRWLALHIHNIKLSSVQFMVGDWVLRARGMHQQTIFIKRARK